MTNKCLLKHLFGIDRMTFVMRVLIVLSSFLGATNLSQATTLSSLTASNVIYNGTALTPVLTATPSGATYSYTLTGGTTSTTATNVGTYTLN